MLRCHKLLLLPALLAVAALADDGAVLLDETFTVNSRGWLVDEYSRFQAGGYVIDARNRGGYYRWLNEPADLRDFTCQVDVQKLRGTDQKPLFGLIFRVQDSWRNSYFFVINGAGGYYFGKLVEGSAVILKQGTEAAVKAAGATNTLVVRASGTTFGLAVNETPIANVIDDTFPTGGRVGVCVEAPAVVRFDNLRVTALGGGPANGTEAPPSGVRTLFEDRFETNSGWAEDTFREVTDGAYHLANQGERKSFISWHPKTAGLKDFVARIDARQVSGDPNALFGLCWRLRDGQNFYFFLINPDGRYYAGIRIGDEIYVSRQGRQPAIRPGEEANTLGVRAAGRQFTLKVNGQATCEFSDDRLSEGMIGVYLEQPAHVTFDDLLVTDLPENAPPVVGGGTGRPWEAGAIRLHERLDRNGAGYTWPTDEDHRFERGGYCVTAPEKGSRVVTCEKTRSVTDGVFMVNALVEQGPVQSGVGLIVRVNDGLDSFYFLTMNAAGRYYVGRCIKGEFKVLDSGPVAQLRGGDVGNDLQVTIEGPAMKYGINDHLLGTIRDEALTRGAVGLYVEHGATARFRDLRVYNLPRE